MTNDPAGSDSLDELDEFEKRLAGEAGGSVQISTKAHVLTVEDEKRYVGKSVIIDRTDKRARSLRYSITLEALLIGHETGLTNVNWSPLDSTSLPRLLSSSYDNSLIIWTPSFSSSTSKDGIWVPAHRFGSIGGRSLGFYGAIWGQDGKSVLASGWSGGWEKWKSEAKNDRWEPKPGVNGHFGAVSSVSWSSEGDCLLSVRSALP